MPTCLLCRSAVSSQALKGSSLSQAVQQVKQSSAQRSAPLEGHPRYEFIMMLSNGPNGLVQLAWDRQELQERAIKFVDRGSTNIKQLVREIFNQVFLTPDYLAIVTEYAAGGDLAEYVAQRTRVDSDRALPEDLARFLFQQLVIGLDFCHQMGIANRDIKLENTLLMDSSDRPVLKLCDFGYSKDEFMGSACKTMCGTPEYVAPEVLLNDEYSGCAADVWSCGVVLYVMLAGRFPFRSHAEAGKSPAMLLQLMFPKIIAGAYTPVPDVSESCHDLLRRMLTVNPEQRITVPEIMRHQWFMKDLPEGLLEANASLLDAPLALQFCSQSEEEIQRLATQAANEQAALPGQPGPDELPY